MQPLEHRNLTGRVRQELLARIQDGRQPAGSQLPAEVDLARSLGVSRTSLREALLQLEQEGTIVRRHGYGTFVRSAGVLHNNLDRNLSATDLIRGHGMEPGTRDTRLSSSVAGSEEAELLQIEEGSPTVVLERVRTADGRPVVFTVDVISAALFASASVDPQELTDPGVSVYRFFADRLGRSVFDGRAHLRVELASPELAVRLAVPRDTPTLVIEQLDFDAAELPVLLSWETYIVDAFDFVIHRRGPGLPTRPEAVPAPAVTIPRIRANPPGAGVDRK
jgi:GntR family transcriptional regulator